MQVGVGHHQFAFVDALETLQVRGDFLEPLGRSAQNDDFQADSVRQVDVGGRDDQVGVVVLQLGLVDSLVDLRA